MEWRPHWSRARRRKRLPRRPTGLSGSSLQPSSCIVGALPLLHLGQPRWWALCVAALFGLVALLKPVVLHPLSRVWLALGRLLHKIVSPVVMGAIFFLVVTPIGWIQRMIGRDILSLRRNRGAATYWVARDAQPPANDAMKRQF